MGQFFSEDGREQHACLGLGSQCLRQQLACTGSSAEPRVVSLDSIYLEYVGTDYDSSAESGTVLLLYMAFEAV